MSKHKASKMDGQTELVRIGGRAYRIRTQVVIEEIDAEDTLPTGEVLPRGDGCFEIMLSDAEATSIDKSEQAILRTCWPAVRSALSQHLTAVSKKKPNVK